MAQQTVVEWFAEVTAKLGYVSTDILEQAKQMEKDQRIQTYNDGYKDGQSDPDKSKDISECSNGKLYYNETFKK